MDQIAPGRGRRGVAEAYALLLLTTLFWGGHAVVGRMAVGQISPMLLTTMRWTLVLVILAVGFGRKLGRERAAIVAHWRTILLMGAFGFTAFNALFYVAAHYTTAVNIAIFQGSIPLLVLVGTVLVYGARITAFQVVGMMATLLGVLVVGTRGELGTLAAFRFNVGDLLIVLACVFYAGYTLALRDRPSMSGTALFGGLCCAAFASSLPLLAAEIAAGRAQWPTPKGWVVLVLVAIFPSFLAQVFFIRAVELIGPGRAGLFVNLVPVFGAALAVLVLSEPFAPYHLVSLGLVLGGILFAETAGALGSRRETAAPE